MEYAKVRKAKAESAKRLLTSLDAFDASRDTMHSRSYVYFPVLDTDAKTKKLISDAGIAIASREGARRAAKADYDGMLSGMLDKEERKGLARGYELLGSIAIIEISNDLKKKEKRIARALMDANPRIETVLAKVGGVYGVYRKRRLRYIAGTKNYTAVHRENGCTFRFDVRRVFFSSKLAYERSRIISMVRDNEHVVVVGSGVGPFAIEIAKSRKNAKVVGIEPNRYAHGYMLENIKANRTPNVEADLGDVRKVYLKRRSFADRIIIPMPTSSLRFLNPIVAMAKKRAVIHIYVFGKTGSVLADSWRVIEAHAKMNDYRAKRLGHRIVRPYSAKDAELCIDFRIEKGTG
jgi:tRNA (guanine37-N1)-methyltransferase